MWLNGGLHLARPQLITLTALHALIMKLDKEFKSGALPGLAHRCEAIYDLIRGRLAMLFDALVAGSWDAGYDCSSSEIAASKQAFQALRRRQ